MSPVAGPPDAGDAKHDPQALQDLHDADPESAAELIDEISAIYETDARERLSAMAQAVQDGDAQAVHRSSHPLASASGSLGLLEMQALCRVIDADARDGRTDAARAHLGDLVDAFDAACRWLSARRAYYRDAQR